MTKSFSLSRNRSRECQKLCTIFLATVGFVETVDRVPVSVLPVLRDCIKSWRRFDGFPMPPASAPLFHSRHVRSAHVFHHLRVCCHSRESSICPLSTSVRKLPVTQERSLVLPYHQILYGLPWQLHPATVRAVYLLVLISAQLFSCCRKQC